MGNYATKIFSRNNENESKPNVQASMTMGNLEKLEKSQMCTPVSLRKPTLDDPRSASSGIARTPIEVSRFVASALPKHLRARQYLETDLDNIIMSSPPEEKYISDPRSPNVDHQRTPILVKSLPNYLTPVVVVNEGPDSLTPEGVGIDPRSPAINFDRTPILKPKSFEHSQVSQEISNKEKTDLSNTKISYCETTTGILSVKEVQVLPEVNYKQPSNFQDRLLACADHDSSGESYSSCGSSSDNSDSEEQITVIPNFKALKLEEKSQMNDTIDEDVYGNALENDSNIEDFKNAEDTRGRIRIWQDSTSPHLTEAINNGEVNRNPEEIIIEFDDNTVLKSTKSEPQKLAIVDEIMKNQGSVGKSMKVQCLKKNFGNVFKDVGDVNEPPKNRTPLGNRSNNSKMGVHNNSPQQLFRNKGLSTNQQENTPPNMKRFRGKNKTNGNTWDPDSTFII